MLLLHPTAAFSLLLVLCFLLYLGFIVWDVFFTISLVTFHFDIVHILIWLSLWVFFLILLFTHFLSYLVFKLLGGCKELIISNLLFLDQKFNVLQTFLSILEFASFDKTEAQEVPWLHNTVVFLNDTVQNFNGLFELLQLNKQTRRLHSKVNLWDLIVLSTFWVFVKLILNLKNASDNLTH